MPVSPVPSSRPSRDNDALAGRGGLVGGSRAPATRQIGGGPGAGPDAASTDGADQPALLTDDGRGVVTILNEARDLALQVGDGLDQLTTAGDGLTRVQKLVDRMRDMAVVAMDRSLEPAERARLQRAIDLSLTEIDEVADDTLLDGQLLQGPAETVGTAQQSQASRSWPTPFRAIGASALGLSELGVRSPDQALAASGALDVATSRLQRQSEALGRATARLEAELDGLTNPGTTATGDAVLGNSTVALSSSMLLRRQLVANPDRAVQSQASLDVARVMRLLDSSAR